MNVLTDEVTHPYWQFFLALEADLAVTTRYVELVQDNFNAYSIEFAKILLSASSEVDVVCRVLAAQIGVQPPPDSIKEHRNAILGQYPRFYTITIDVPRYGLALRPWASWEMDESPPWWKGYNAVKHHRNTSYADANLQNALHSVAGLFAVVLYLYHDDLFRDSLTPWPSLLSIEARPTALSLEDRYRLPDFGHFGGTSQVTSPEE